VKKLFVPDITGAIGDMYAADDRCHIVRLVPRN
jgi:hypothetical protein